MKVKGVNLGNWLVLEKWMNPALFAGTTAEDEYWLQDSCQKKRTQSVSVFIEANISQREIL